MNIERIDSLDEKIKKQRVAYIAIAIMLIGIEFVIGLFVHDKIIRPYVGDIIVVVILYAIVRAVTPRLKQPVAAYVFVFSAAYEFTQMLPLVDVLGIHNQFLRVLMGTSFSWMDIVCYLIGCSFCFGQDLVIRKAIKRDMHE